MQIGLNVHSDYQPQVFQELRARGFTSLRITAEWRCLEPTPSYINPLYRDKLKNLVTSAIEMGFSVMVVLDAPPSWAGGTRPKPILWQGFVSQVVTLLRGLCVTYEVYNEPNTKRFFTGKPKDYINEILIPAAEVVKSVDLTALVAGPGLAHVGNYFNKDKWWWYWLETVLKRATTHLDVITHHVYGAATSKDLWRDLDGSRWEWYEGPNLKKVAKRTTLPFVLTEIGWKSAPNSSQAAQAQNYRTFLAAKDRLQWIAKTYFYEMRDDPNIENQWGLYTHDLRPKAALAEFARVSKPQEGRSK